MRIAIDYDDTYTLNPEMWNEIIEVMRKHDCSVACVTSRRKTFDNIKDISEATGLSVVCCDYNAKAEVMRKLGLRVDVWIDDNPYCIDPYGKCQPAKYQEWEARGE